MIAVMSVPTMGYLHNGHLSLVRMMRARSTFITDSFELTLSPGRQRARQPRGGRHHNRAATSRHSTTSLPDVVVLPSYPCLWPRITTMRMNAMDRPEQRCADINI